MASRGFVGIFEVIIIVYIIFIAMYGLCVAAMTDFFSGSQYVSVQKVSNVTGVGNYSIGNDPSVGTRSMADQSQSLKCSGDVFGCSKDIIVLMFSVDSMQTPFATFNYFVWMFTLMFLASCVAVFAIPLMQAIGTILPF